MFTTVQWVKINYWEALADFSRYSFKGPGAQNSIGNIFWINHSSMKHLFWKIWFKTRTKRGLSRISTPISSQIHINYKGRSASKNISKSGPNLKKKLFHTIYPLDKRSTKKLKKNKKKPADFFINTIISVNFFQKKPK